MERPPPWWRPRRDGLAPRVALYLSLALLPLGLIALYQTREYQQETEERAELTLLALTAQAAAGVEQAIEEAVGAAEALALAAPLLDDPETCRATLSRFVGEGRPYQFVGLVPPEGPVTCSSAAETFDPDERDDWAALLSSPRPAVRARSAGTVSGDDVLIVAVPVPEGPPPDAAPEAGPAIETAEPAADSPATAPPVAEPTFVVLSLPRSTLARTPVGLSEFSPLRLVTFGADGDVLTSADGNAGDPAAPLADLLPPGRSLADEAGGVPRVFTDESASGSDQVYTVTPLIPGLAYALAVWDPEQAGQAGTGASAPILFPLLMWATSLAVAFWAIHRLFIRRVNALVGRMRRFGRDRSLPDGPAAPGSPQELREIEDAFRLMASSILQDEARMENAFRERGVLLREVHHRVKNNLQLISSIISMQVRRMPDPGMRGVLRRLQDRVLTLAAIYRSLYTSPDMSEVNAAPVLRSIVEQELRASEGRVEVTLDIEDMVLDSDKVVPLAFLAAEAVSNAVRRAASVEGRPSLSVSLHREGGHVGLRIVNSLAGPPQDDPSQGLGQHLIHAFAAQLGGPAEIEADERLYRLSVSFPVEATPAEVEPA